MLFESQQVPHYNMIQKKIITLFPIAYLILKTPRKISSFFWIFLDMLSQKTKRAGPAGLAAEGTRMDLFADLHSSC